jgi:hypothetical protein
MDTLALRPLPTETKGENRIHLRLRDEGFVDESLISGVIARGVYERVFVEPEGMVLSSSEDDFAGWALPVPSPFRGMRETEAPASAPARLPAPPVPAVSETGIAAPYAGGHRWWLFGAGGAMTCGLLSLTLLSLAQRSEVRGIAVGFMPEPIQAEAPASPTAEPAAEPALTRALPDFR